MTEGRGAGSSTRGLIASLTRGIYRAEDWLLVVLVVTLTALAVVSVVLRYVFASPIQWTEEASLLLFNWLVFVGAAVTWRQHAHPAIELVVDRLSPRGKRIIWLFNYLAIALVLVALCYLGVSLAISNAAIVSVQLGVPRFVFNLALPVGSLLMLMHTAEFAIPLARGLTQVRSWTASDDAIT